MKEIKHYLIPKLTEHLYEKEAISSIALTKGIAEKINELVDAYNNLYRERLTKVQEQDGKIEKGILYMKDNLANTLHDMFEVMENAGEISALLNDLLPEILRDEYTFVPLETEVVNGVNVVKDVRYPYGNVKRYGAIGDGITDDTKALQNASDVCVANGFNLYANEGTYLISSNISFRYIMKVVFNGDIITNNESRVTIGNTSSAQNGGSFTFNDVNTIYVLGLKNGDVKFNNIEHLSIYADGMFDENYSVAYNTFTGNKATKVSIESGGYDKIGWVNENVFNIKRVEHILIDGNYPHNNNHFEHCNLEKGTVELKNARNNYISARCEGGVTIIDNGNTEMNFLEEEYYYKHYFGLPPKETENNTVSYYPVHKVQTEENILRINSANKHFPIGSLVFDSDGRFIPASYNEIFRSDFVEITDTIALKVKSDQKCFRVRVTFYDVNKNPIPGGNAFFDGRMSRINGEWEYMIQSNTDNDTLTIYKNRTVKYFKYSIIFGNIPTDMRVKYITAKLIKLINSDCEVYNTVEFDKYTQVPTSGYWEQGHILWGKNPRPGANIGIVCTTSGSPGVWSNFAPVI